MRWLILTLMPLFLLAQEDDATLVGQVLSRAGEPIANARVLLTNLETALPREARTGPDGNFSVRFLTPATYNLTITAADFQPGAYEGFLLRPGQILRLDFRLRPAREVRDQAAPVYTWMQTDTPAVRRLVEQRNIRDLPLLSRNFTQLVLLLPGLLPAGSLFTASGYRPEQNRFILDGVEFLDSHTSAPAFAPSIDSLTEIKVESSTYSARYGFAPGAHVDLVTRSGASQYHGTLWAFNRNDALAQTHDAASGLSLTPPRVNRNQFGLNFGGPLQVPRLLAPEATSFVFLNWEDTRLREATLPPPLRVPTLAQRAGQMEAGPLPDGLRDPFGQLFPGAQVPPSRWNSTAQALLRATPLPNLPAGPRNYLPLSQPAASRQDNITARLDQRLRSNNLFTARYTINEFDGVTAPLFGADTLRHDSRAQNALAQYTRSFGPRRVNQFRLGWNRFRDRQTLPPQNGLPSATVAGLGGPVQLFQPPRLFDAQFRTNDAFQLSNVLAWQRGAHMFRIGGDYFYRLEAQRQARNPRGAFTHDGAYTGSAFADFLLGYARSLDYSPTLTTSRLQSSWAAVFFQDDWRARPGLTLNFGWRWDYLSPYAATRGQLLNLEQSRFTLTQPILSPHPRYGQRMRQTSPTNNGPRFGLAWAPTSLPGLVLRAGYGFYFAPPLPHSAFRLSEAAQDFRSLASRSANALTPDLFLTTAFPTPQSTISGLAISVDPLLRDAYAQHWNLSLQRKVPLNFFFDAGYIGSKSARLPVLLPDLNRPLNPADPRQPTLAPLAQRRPFPSAPQPVPAEISSGSSTYHSFQASAFRTSPAGLELVLAYTFSKCLSGPSDSGNWLNPSTAPQDLYNFPADRSLCAHDIAHRFTGSAIYETRLRRPSPRLQRLFNGWRIAAIPTLSTGLPAELFSSLDTTATGLPSRPDHLSPATLPADSRTYARWFHPGALAAPPAGRFGNAPRLGAFRLPGLRHVDLSFGRSFAFTEARKLEFRAELFNATRTFNAPGTWLDTHLGSPAFGSIAGGLHAPATRTLQLGLKLLL